ncbi:MAG: Positive regulator of CheA protein activity (CheW) [Anaerolineae bacterium]|jgi:purine-binding chemotaxis protein CheW|nr:MAG: Positive regulator of CheA protein activity (CheW) [Anaerolineae bacterium]
MERQLVVFELANEHYGVDIAAVESIIKMQPITAVPQAPAFVEGITNLRGSVLPVMDLRKRFGLSGRDQSSESTQDDKRIVVVSMDGMKIGMIVDAVSEVLRVQEEAIEPPPPMVTTINSAFITGIAKVGERLIILLDLAKVLTVSEKDEVANLEAVV